MVSTGALTLCHCPTTHTQTHVSTGDQLTVYCASSYLSQVPLLRSQVTRQRPQTGTGLGHLSSPEVALFKCYSWDTNKWSRYHHSEIKKSGNKQDWEDGKLGEHKLYNCSEEQFCKNVSFFQKSMIYDAAIPLWGAYLEKTWSSEEKYIPITLVIAVVLMLKWTASISLGKEMMESIQWMVSINHVHLCLLTWERCLDVLNENLQNST